MASLDQARAAKPKAHETFSKLADADVVGVGITRVDSGYGVKVNLAREPGNRAQLPCDIDGVPIRVEVVGQVRKRASG